MHVPWLEAVSRQYAVWGDRTEAYIPGNFPALTQPSQRGFPDLTGAGVLGVVAPGDGGLYVVAVALMGAGLIASVFDEGVCVGLIADFLVFTSIAL